jgi:hypothetical protein
MVWLKGISCDKIEVCVYNAAKWREGLIKKVLRGFGVVFSLGYFGFFAHAGFLAVLRGLKITPSRQRSFSPSWHRINWKVPSRAYSYSYSDAYGSSPQAFGSTHHLPQS